MNAVAAGGCAPPIVVDGPVDLRAALKACEAVITARLGAKRRQFDRDIAAGRIPHATLVAKIERAEYLRDQVRAARPVIGELLAFLKGLNGDCAECAGGGVMQFAFRDLKPGDPCPDCADIRALLAKAGVP